MKKTVGENTIGKKEVIELITSKMVENERFFDFIVMKTAEYTNRYKSVWEKMPTNVIRQVIGDIDEH